MKRKILLLTALLVATTWQYAFSDGAAEETVRFEKGDSSALLRGHVKGWETVEYRLYARAGQVMEVTLQSDNSAAFFNITAPGAEMALFIGADQGTHYKGVLPTDGIYRVLLYLMRNEARRGEEAEYELEFSIVP